MATEYVKVMTDDMSGDKADKTMEFSLSGVDYEIDLSDKNFTKYVNQFQELISHARVVGRRKGKMSKSRGNGATGMSSEQLAAVRRWARDNGYPNLSDRGRVPGEVLTAFEAAGGLSVNAPRFSAT